MGFHKWQSRARLISEDVNSHIEGWLIRQKDLQAGIFVAEKWLPFMLAFLAHDGVRLSVPCKRFVKLLKNQNAGCSPAPLDFDVFGRRKINIASAIQRIFPSIVE